MTQTDVKLQDLVPKNFVDDGIPRPFPLNRGHYILKGLFWETSCNRPEMISPVKDEIGYRPLFTLKCVDHELQPGTNQYRLGGPNLLRSVYLLYLEASDPAEYKFAMRTFGSWEHWRQLREAVFFQDTYKLMKQALKAKIESEAIEQGRRAAKGLGPQALQAAKWLHDTVRDKAKRGRPSSDEIQGELRREAEQARELSEDADRLGL